jgi:hypothetical protein
MSLDKNYSRVDRKRNGVFYTPDFLAQYLAIKIKSYVEINNIKSIIDPACGDSILLRSFVKEIDKDNLECSPTIIGVDKDNNAISESTLKFNENFLKKFSARFFEKDGLFPGSPTNSKNGWSKFRDKLNCSSGFDIALSNPPWGADLNGYDPLVLSKNFTLAKGQFDIYNLFLEVILENLKNNGLYGLILPDSVFSQEQANLRYLLAQKTSIHLIARLGEKIFPGINRACVVIIGSKGPPKNDHKVNCFKLGPDYKKSVLSNDLTLIEAEKKLAHRVLQKRFLENSGYVFDIDLKNEDKDIFKKIEFNSVPLKTWVTNSRGVELSKKGIVCKCPSCNKWMPNPKSSIKKCSNCGNEFNVSSAQKEKIILNHNGVCNFKFKAGQDLYRYTSFSKSWINTTKDGINYKSLDLYEGKKILVRKTGVGITASLDYENSITNQVVYILKLRDACKNKITLEFILAVLNSRVMTYYLIKKFGENEWKSHPYLTQRMLINLPFPDLDLSSKETTKIINQITEIVKTETKNSINKNISKDNDLYIEKLVAKLFELSITEYEVIFDALKSSQQLIPINRLLNCEPQDIFE